MRYVVRTSRESVPTERTMTGQTLHRYSTEQRQHSAVEHAEPPNHRWWEDDVEDVDNELSIARLVGMNLQSLKDAVVQLKRNNRSFLLNCPISHELLVLLDSDRNLESCWERTSTNSSAGATVFYRDGKLWPTPVNADEVLAVRAEPSRFLTSQEIAWTFIYSMARFTNVYDEVSGIAWEFVQPTGIADGDDWDSIFTAPGGVEAVRYLVDHHPNGSSLLEYLRNIPLEDRTSTLRALLWVTKYWTSAAQGNHLGHSFAHGPGPFVCLCELYALGVRIGAVVDGHLVLRIGVPRGICHKRVTMGLRPQGTDAKRQKKVQERGKKALTRGLALGIQNRHRPIAQISKGGPCIACDANETLIFNGYEWPEEIYNEWYSYPFEAPTSMIDSERVAQEQFGITPRGAVNQCTTCGERWGSIEPLAASPF